MLQNWTTVPDEGCYGTDCVKKILIRNGSEKNYLVYTESGHRQNWLQILEIDDSRSKLFGNLNFVNKVGMGGKVSF